MTNTIYAQKIGMTEAYVGETRRGVTILKVMPMTVVHQKKTEVDGYTRTQVVFGEAPKKTSKALAGHLKKSGTKGRYIREVDGLDSLEIGSSVTGDTITQAGAKVTVTGVSKGKGTAGVVKRWNFAGGPRTHGQSDRERRAGSIGQGTTPGRVFKGKKMSGRMGQDQVTIKNTTVLSYDPTTNNLVIAGPVPGHTGIIVKVSLSKEAPSNFPVVTLTKNNIKTAPVTAPEPTPEVATESEVA